MPEYIPVRAPRGTAISCKGWQQEAAMRMLMNNLDEEVAENPRKLIVYGGSGRAARSWEAFHEIIRALRNLENDETLLVQSGKPVGVFRTFPHSPRVLIANANLVPHWATRDEFNRLEALQLTMYGQMTAGSWIYIGTQGIVQGTYETFAAAARKHFGSSLAGKILLSGGLGGMGGAQPPLHASPPRAPPLDAAAKLRKPAPKAYAARSIESMALHVQPMLEMQKRGAATFDYGNNTRTMASEGGVKNAYDFPGFIPAYIRPMFAEGRGPFRWAALSGNPNDIAITDDLVLELFPEDEVLNRWIHLARQKVRFQGLPARICWLGYGERSVFGERINHLVKTGAIEAPIVIGRDHLDCGSVASPFRETEAMKDGSDAIADWPILNALLNTASGASWVSFHHGGGVGIGYSLHAGQVIVADGTPEMDERLNRVLTNDPGIGVARHADAGYDDARDFARRKGIKI